MSYARLLAATLLFSSLAFCQQATNSVTSSTLSPDASASAQVSAEPWKILANQPGTESGTDPMDHMRVDKFRIDRNTLPLPGTALRAQPGDDTMCYVISSYVVARDSKDSDAVHPVGHTTCVPASRYRLRTTAEHATSDRESHLIRR
jgi:hypothetical protein